ncbi:MAG: DUF362 domain-containing protein [Methanosarcinaceae archaeon]|nr:DUF362 domain-containing protein [Methanosarcinaceae archaeon]
MRSPVSIVCCDDYSRAKEAIIEALDLIGGLDRIISSGDRVLLKPNVLAARTADEAVTTHPAIISAMCELVMDIGGIPVVGDCAGITWPGITDEALDVSGIRDAASECGAEVISFEIAGFSEVTVPDAVHFHSLYLSNVPLEADVVISLPKLKTHELTLYTGAVKNMFGVIPLKTRKQAHLLADRDRFGDAVVDIYSVRVPHLAIMDGVVGMEGNGPSHGKPRKVGVVMASYDCVSMDVVASRLIGFEPMSVPTTAAAIRRGFGDLQPEVVGVAISEAKVKFERSTGGIIGRLPPFVVSNLGRFFTIRLYIDLEKCSHCGACVRNCSAHAIEENDGVLQINDDICLLCYCCRELCPHDAVDMKRSLIARSLSFAQRMLARR